MHQLDDQAYTKYLRRGFFATVGGVRTTILAFPKNPTGAYVS
jgi:hypothetical protein